MISKPLYKIARRLGAPVFEKTQTQKFALRAERKAKSKKQGKPKSEYGIQQNEKQKTRMVYGVSEKQFTNYVKSAVEKKASRAVSAIYEALELRLDNAVYRMGLASTRRGARQMVSHGHITVNGRKVTVPSLSLSVGDVVAVREGSAGSTLFSSFDDRFKQITVPAWMSVDPTKKKAEITGMPAYTPGEALFDLNAVVEFYSR